MFDHFKSERAMQAAQRVLGRSDEALIQTDELAVLSHLVNGWGLSYLPDAAALWDHKMPPWPRARGDGHPGQLVAYSIMAGALPDTPVGHGVLHDLLESKGYAADVPPYELGHLLFAAARLGMERIGGTDIGELATDAVAAFDSPGRGVCHHIHLIEGVCAVSRLRPDLRPSALRLRATKVARMTSMNDILAHEPERFVTYDHALQAGGHLLELMALAWQDGIEPSEAERVQMGRLADHLSSIFLKYEPMMSAWPHPGRQGHAVCALRLLKGLMPHRTSEAEAPKLTLTIRSKPRSRFQAIIDQCPDAWGLAWDWRQIRVPGWPRRVHYELVDTGQGVSVELHLEGDEVAHLASTLQSVATEDIEWDPDFFEGHGRLRWMGEHQDAIERLSTLRRITEPLVTERLRQATR